MSTWKAWFDGATEPNPGQRGIGGLLVSPDGTQRIEISAAIGHGTNNEAEYSALQAVLDKAIELGIQNILIRGDSQLVINQVKGDWACRAPGLFPYLTAAKTAMRQIPNAHLSWVPREENEEADYLSSIALGNKLDTPSEARQWTNQKEIGRVLGISAIAVGKRLEEKGFRKEKMPTQAALDAGIAKVTDNHFGKQVSWHAEKTVLAIGGAG